MNKVKKLEIKKLFKELEYIESDFEYRSEIISEADYDFIGKVNNFLEGHPELKELYDKKITDTLNNNFIKKVEEIKEIDSDIDLESIVEVDSKPVKIKKLYRDIVKLTHPDKISKKSLNDIYMEATEHYKLNNSIGLYKICQILDISWDIDDSDSLLISDRINELRSKINFLESTITWKWLKTEDEREKNELMFNFIKMRIG